MPLLLLILRALISPLALAAAALAPPLMPDGADPTIVLAGGNYYYSHTTGTNVTLWKSATIAGLWGAVPHVVWTPPAPGPASKEIWAPELVPLGQHCFIYFAADDGDEKNHGMFALESKTSEPLDGFDFKGK